MFISPHPRHTVNCLKVEIIFIHAKYGKRTLSLCYWPGTVLSTRLKDQPIQSLPPKFSESGTEPRSKPALQSGKCPNIGKCRGGPDGKALPKQKSLNWGLKEKKGGDLAGIQQVLCAQQEPNAFLTLTATLWNMQGGQRMPGFQFIHHPLPTTNS